MKATISPVAKSTKDYPRPCRGSSLMGIQELATHDGWPTPKGHAPRLAGLVGCATGRKNAEGEDTREAGPAQVARDAIAESLVELEEADDLADVLHTGDAQ